MFTKSTSSLSRRCHPYKLSHRPFTKTLFERMKERVPEMQDRAKQIIAQTKDTKISEVSVSQAMGGMRDAKALICETSELSSEGIKFRGLDLREIENKLPTGKCRGAQSSEYPIPESMLWLLLTGEVPTDEEAAQLSQQLTSEPYNSGCNIQHRQMIGYL